METGKAWKVTVGMALWLGLATGGQCCTLPLAAPLNLTASLVSTKPQTQINLNWVINSTSQDGFNIEVNTGNGWSGFGTEGPSVTGGTFILGKLLLGYTSYSFRVYAFCLGPNDNPNYSNTATVTIPKLPKH